MTLEAAIMAMGGFRSDAEITKVIVTRPKVEVVDGESKHSLGIRMLDCSQPTGRSFQLLPGDTVHVRKASAEK